MKTIKGFSLFSVIIIILVIAAVATVAYFLGKGGPGWGDGKGNNEGQGDAEAVQVDVTVETTQAITTNEILYVEITVSDKKYIFNNISYEIDDIGTLISDIKSTDEKFTVRITDEYASSKAYERLTTELNKEKIRFIEVSQQEE